MFEFGEIFSSDWLEFCSAALSRLCLPGTVGRSAPLWLFVSACLDGQVVLTEFVLCQGSSLFSCKVISHIVRSF